MNFPDQSQQSLFSLAVQITIFTKRCVNLLSIIYISFCRYTGCRFLLFGVFDDFIHAITGVIFSDLIKKLFTTLIRVSSMALMRRRCHALRTATFCQPVILAVAIPSWLKSFDTSILACAASLASLNSPVEPMITAKNPVSSKLSISLSGLLWVLLSFILRLYLPYCAAAHHRFCLLLF